MAIPQNREEFAQYCLRKLGHPVINIDVSPDQVDDRITEALQMFRDYHFDASDKIYYKHQVSEQDIENKYIEVPENIFGAVSIFPIGSPSMGSQDMFNIQYQIALNDLYTLTSVSMVPYYMAMQHLSLIEEMLVGKQPIRYTRHKNRLYVDMEWGRMKPGQFLLVEAFEVIDPDQWTDVWGDRWLQNYATAKIKYQWASNLTKFTQMSLPGGMQFNGDRLLTDAQMEIEKMEAELIMSYSMPVSDFYG